MAEPSDVLAGFERAPFVHDGITHDVYRAGSGPGVVVIAEVPGITPEVAGFARRVIDLGCTAVLPSLFGRPGAAGTVANTLRVLPRLCIAKEFGAFATGRTTPVIGWLRALAADEHGRLGGPGVGVVGMCFTGGFALAMLTEPAVVAPVLSQPSLPLGVTKRQRADLGLSPADLRGARARLHADADLCVLGLRFAEDPISPPARFAALREALGDRFVGVEIPGKGHSVLTTDLVDEPGHPTRDALDQVLELFRSRLLGAPR